MQFAYITLLLLSLLSMFVIDRRYTVALYADKRRSLLTILFTVIVFLVWDISGVVLGVFFNGDSPYDLGLFVLPEVPIEEVLFLSLLAYLSLIVYRLSARWIR